MNENARFGCGTCFQDKYNKISARVRPEVNWLWKRQDVLVRDPHEKFKLVLRLVKGRIKCRRSLQWRYTVLLAINESKDLKNDLGRML